MCKENKVDGLSGKKIDRCNQTVDLEEIIENLSKEKGDKNEEK